MIKLLHFHMIYSKKMIIKTFLIVLIAFIFPSLQMGEFNLSLFMFMVSIYLPKIISSHILDGKFSTLIYTFPILPKQFVQSTYLYMTLLLGLFIAPTLFWNMLQLYTGDANAFDFYLIFSIFSYCILATGSTIKEHFRNPTNDNPFSGSNALFYLLFISISQTFIGFFLSGLFDMHFGALIIPAICAWLFYRQYKSALSFYEKAEFL